MKKNKTFLIIFLIGFIVFILYLIPNSKGIRDEHMLSLLSQDESIQYSYLTHMLTPGNTFFETLKNFVSYQHYFYGYPFYFYSALVVLPFRLIFGSQFFSMTQVNLLILRQLVSVLPMLISAGLLTYLQTRFKSTWKTVLLFVFLLSIPAVLANNFWFWHPDAMTLLGVVLTIFFLDRDHNLLGRNFYYAAIACGFTAATKVIGFFFFLAVIIYLVFVYLQKQSGFGKIIRTAFFFTLIMLAVFILLNPLLLFPQTRAQIFKIQSQQNFFVTHGWQDEDTYTTGLSAWLPYLQQWYAFPVFILFLFVSLGYTCGKGERRLTNWLILGWFIPYSVYLVFFVAIKPTHYWLPTFLPLASTAFVFLPDDLFNHIEKKKSSKKNFSRVSLLALLSLGLIGFQTAQYLKTDISLTTRFMEKERLLLACNSNPDNSTLGLTVNLDASRWYRLETYDNRGTPAIREFTVIRGTSSVAAFPDYGQSAWACISQTEAIFSAQRLAILFKEAYPKYKVIGPDGKEISP